MSRRRNLYLWGLLLLAALLPAAAAGCGAAGTEQVYAEPADHVDARLVEGNTAFGINLFQALRGEAPDKNILISPASVSAALAMTYNGAAGETQAAMAEALQLQGMSREEINGAFADLLSILRNPDPRVELAIANSLWMRAGEPFHEDFRQRNRDYFRAELNEIDFAAPEAAQTINDWVKEQTRDKIAEIVVAPLDPRTIMFLINAIYFNGAWTKEFNADSTREIPFTLPGGKSKEHPVMFQEGEFSYLEGDGFAAARLPYGENERVGMYLFLPDRESSLADFYGDLNAANWSRWIDSFQVREGEIGLPRFKYEYEATLNECLKALGMAVAFNGDEADFSDMRPIPPNLYISEVKHKTFIEVNEAGTEAAAATSVEMRVTSMPLDNNNFSLIVDRPFFFSIVDDQTGAVLFMGSVADPGQE
jgi:serine protease inhibitor